MNNQVYGGKLSKVFYGIYPEDVRDVTDYVKPFKDVLHCVDTHD